MRVVLLVVGTFSRLVVGIVVGLTVVIAIVLVIVVVDGIALGLGGIVMYGVLV